MRPLPFKMAITMENSRPDTTGAGMANFRSIADRLTMACPRKITMAAKPRLVRYSNLNALTAPSTPGV